MLITLEKLKTNIHFNFPSLAKLRVAVQRLLLIRAQHRAANYNTRFPKDDKLAMLDQPFSRFLL